MLSGVIRKAVSFGAILGLASVMALPAMGQIGFPEGGGGNDMTAPPTPGDIQTLYNSAGLDVLDASAFGDNVDIDTGALSFQHTDVSLPGNSSLPVALTRQMSRAAILSGNASRFVIPHIRQKYIDTNGAPLPDQSPTSYYGPQADRCTTEFIGGTSPFLRIAFGSQGLSGAQDETVLLQKHEFYDGLTMIDAGGGSHQLLLNGSERTIPQPTPASPEFTASGNSPRLVSKDNWVVDCLPTTKNDQGEGWIATAPNGDTYKFDYVVHVRMPQATWPNPRQPIYQELLYVSEITDVHGNWVRYDYSGNSLRRIRANDGRRIDISSSNGNTTVTAHGRTWTYSSTQNGLKVTLPDGRFWEMGPVLDSGDYKPFQANGSEREMCEHFDWMDYRVRHPSGSVATFSFDVIHNGKYKLSDPIENHDYGPHIMGLPEFGSCGPIGAPLSHPSVFRSLAVTQKSVTVPNDGTHVWTWEYEQDAGSFETYTQGVPQPQATSPIKTRKTTKPDGSYMVTHINRQFGFTEGQIEKVESFDANNSLMQTEEFAYEYGNLVGVGYGQNSRQHARSARYRVYQTSRVLTQDGESYTTAREFQTNPAASDFAYGAPRKVTQSSTLQSTSRVNETTYEHKKDKWILGLPKTTTRNGKLFTSNTYNGLGLLTRSDQFGVRQASLTYNSDGTLASFKDALNRESKFKDWHRGQAQRFELPESTVTTQIIDDNGWITSQTDPRGNTTTLTYDTGGRVTRVDRPGTLANIEISYAGLGTGSLTRTVNEGTLRTTTKHDGFLRPYQTRQQAIGGSAGGSIYSRTEYDGLGRVIFQSFPKTSLSVTTTGVETTYDGLGRVTQTRENVAPFATTRSQYLSDNRTRVTDAMGNITTTTASGYGSPGDGNPTRITQPESIATVMVYDIYGNLLRASRNGFTQRWRYDDRLRLCNAFTPETRGTRYLYDNANQVIAYAEGHTQSCGNPSSVNRVTNTYDDLGRITRVNYPTGTPDTSMTYDANGNILTNHRGGANWTYTYDENDQLLDETLAIDGRSYTSSYTYNANGFLLARGTTTGARTISFRPDGFGRPTRARAGGKNKASNVTYHPNGAIKSFTYGSGYVYTATLNNRQQTLRMSTVNGTSVATDFQYSYNANGQIIAINDRSPENDDRAYTYDGLNRLVAATGVWGDATYTYDTLNNLKGKQIGARTVTTAWDTSKNRLSAMRDSADGALHAYTYDTRGNVIGDGNYVFIYDRANQPTAMSGGGTTGSFEYDGNYKRVKQTINGETIYSFYSISGELFCRDNATTGIKTDYIRMGGKTIARVKTGGDITYLHQDHLGSPVAATGESGAVLWREATTPFGETLGEPLANTNDEGFTGHIRDSDTGLTYMSYS